LKAFDMAYFMISVDDPETNKEFAESLDSDFPLLSNPTKEVAEAYGVVTAERAFPFRWTYIIGGDGKILKIDKEVNPSAAGQDLVADLKALGVG
jgi:peroxiredoxin Q/BCP|tara:strand:- start:581 stop:862 length:282 start_codon:yes stop_codon:yes gene_type:complete